MFSRVYCIEPLRHNRNPVGPGRKVGLGEVAALIGDCVVDRLLIGQEDPDLGAAADDRAGLVRDRTY